MRTLRFVETQATSTIEITAKGSIDLAPFGAPAALTTLLSARAAPNVGNVVFGDGGGPGQRYALPSDTFPGFGTIFAFPCSGSSGTPLELLTNGSVNDQLGVARGTSGVLSIDSSLTCSGVFADYGITGAPLQASLPGDQQIAYVFETASTAVPLPPAIALMLGGLGLLASLRRRA